MHYKLEKNRVGKIIFLNGPSSSGKTSIAREFQNNSDDVYYCMSIDGYYSYLPIKTRERIVNSCKRNEKDGFDWTRFWSGYFRTIASVASAGNNVIADCVCYGESLFLAASEFGDLQVTYVKVYCDYDEIEKREKNRRDRIVGMATSQWGFFVNGGVYDFCVDTTNEEPRQSAIKIIEWLKEGEQPTAFKKLNDKLQNISI